MFFLTNSNIGLIRGNIIITSFYFLNFKYTMWTKWVSVWRTIKWITIPYWEMKQFQFEIEVLNRIKKVRELKGHPTSSPRENWMNEFKNRINEDIGSIPFKKVSDWFEEVFDRFNNNPSISVEELSLKTRKTPLEIIMKFYNAWIKPNTKRWIRWWQRFNRTNNSFKSCIPYLS